MLSVKNLTISYGKNTVVEDASFEAKSGGITLILGGNGTGKSSILKAIIRDAYFTGKCKYSSITYLNKEITNFDKFRRDIAYIPQGYNANEFISKKPLDELYYVANLSKQYDSKKDAEDKINELIKTFDKDEKIKNAKDVKTLSGGQRCLLNIMVGLIKKSAKLIILDEPINNLDSTNAVKVSNALTKYAREKNVAILVVTHCRIFPNANAVYRIVNKKLQLEQDYNCYSECFGQLDTETGMYKLN